MTERRVPAPPPPNTLTVAGAAYADHLASLVKDTGDPKYVRSVDALTVLRVAGNVRVAFRAWENQWNHYEAELVHVLRRAGVKDSEIARALGVERQNLL